MHNAQITKNQLGVKLTSGKRLYYNDTIKWRSSSIWKSSGNDVFKEY